MKTYLIVLDVGIVTKEMVQEWFTSILDVVPYWYSELPNAIFFLSNHSETQLAERFKSKFQTALSFKFIITQVPSSSQGVLLPQAWQMINTPNDTIHAKNSFLKTPYYDELMRKIRGY